jgi:AcrR family transcriptional regulator
MSAIPSGERADSAANRERIVAAASEVFGRRGPDAEVKEIAAAAGVGVGTLYRHFRNREDLLRALIEKTNDDLRGRLEGAAAAEDARTGLREVIRIGVDTYERLGGLMELAIAGRLHSYMPAGHDDFQDLLVRLLERGMQSGVFRADLQPVVAIAVLRSIFMSGQLAELVATHGYEGAGDALTRFMLHACGAEPDAW